MIPINELQAKIYQCLSDLDIKVYDEVPLNSPMPLISMKAKKSKGMGRTRLMQN